MSLLTVVVWDTGNAHVRPVGPTSNDSQLLRKTRDDARLTHDGAEIVEWSRRNDTVRQIRALVAAREAACEAQETYAESVQRESDRDDGPIVRCHKCERFHREFAECR